MPTARKASRVMDVLKILRWPVCVLIIILAFYNPIYEMLPKLIKGDIQISNKGFNLTFEQSIQSQVSQLDGLQSDIKKIIDTAATSRDRAITVAWDLLERKLRRIMAVSHWNNGVHRDVKSSISVLIDLGVLAKNNLPNLTVVDEEHSRILEHREAGIKTETEAAIITAIQILRNLYAISLVDNIVEAVGVKLYSDEDCKIEISGATGIMIKKIMIDGLEPSYSIFPTTRTDYTVGEHLTWDWNMSRIWRILYFRDPKTGEVNSIRSAEFIGSIVDDL